MFGPEVQLTTEGDIIAFDEQEYEWVAPIINKMSVLPTSHPLLGAIPQHRKPLKMLLKALKRLSQRNFIPAVFVLGEQNQGGKSIFLRSQFGDVIYGLL